ncbi:hypothetical protein E4U53_007275 [Claviceps sorghi]|nr:hypothetical protein E4U53_007275 [Claviceps sorghi]
MADLSRGSGPLNTGGSSPNSPPPSQPTSQQPSSPPASPNGPAISTTPQQQPPAAAPSSSPPPAANPGASSSSPPPQQPPPAAATSSSSSPPPPVPNQTSTPPSTPEAPPAPTTSSPGNPAPAATTQPPQQPATGVRIVTVVRGNSFTTTQVVTTITAGGGANPDGSAQPSASSTPAAINPGGDGSGGGISQGAQVAIGVVVPIAAIALLALLGLWWWRKRKARQESEEERRKEVEDYAYNPNADPSAPALGLGPDAYEMREGDAGYRGWGSTTAAGSMGRKASTTMSGGMTAGTLSDSGGGGGGGGHGHTRGNLSDANADSNVDASSSHDGEILGVMGPAAANNRSGDVHRGPSNASSSYSATGRSEGSDVGLYANGGGYYDPYATTAYGGDQRAQELGGPAVIRDNPARRNTRIENPSHYPQQSAGIAQNF